MELIAGEYRNLCSDWTSVSIFILSSILLARLFVLRLSARFSGVLIPLCAACFGFLLFFVLLVLSFWWFLFVCLALEVSRVFSLLLMFWNFTGILSEPYVKIVYLFFGNILLYFFLPLFLFSPPGTLIREMLDLWVYPLCLLTLFLIFYLLLFLLCISQYFQRLFSRSPGWPLPMAILLCSPLTKFFTSIIFSFPRIFVVSFS